MSFQEWNSTASHRVYKARVIMNQWVPTGNIKSWVHTRLGTTCIIWFSMPLYLAWVGRHPLVTRRGASWQPKCGFGGIGKVLEQTGRGASPATILHVFASACSGLHMHMSHGPKQFLENDLCCGPGIGSLLSRSQVILLTSWNPTRETYFSPMDTCSWRAGPTSLL